MTSEYKVEASHSNDIEKVKKVFYLSVHQLQTKAAAKLDCIFSQIDQYLILKNGDKKDHMKHYRDIPLPLDRLYKEHDYVKSRHGHDLQVKFEAAQAIPSKKRRRQVTAVKDSFGMEEESMF